MPKQEVAQICQLPHKFSFAAVKQSSSWFCLLPVNRCITLCWTLVCSWSTHRFLDLIWPGSYGVIGRDLRFVRCLLCLFLIFKIVWWVWSDSYISSAEVPWGSAGSLWVPCWRSWLGELVTSLLAPLAWSLVLDPVGQLFSDFLSQETHDQTPAPPYWWGIYPHILWEDLWGVLSTPPTWTLWKGWRKFLLSIWLTSPLIFPISACEMP